MVSRALLATLLVAGCTSPTTLEIELPASIEARTVSVYLVSACDAVTPGLVPATLRPPTLLREGETAMALGPAPADAFGVAVIARDAACELVAAGCADTTRGARAVRVVLAARGGQGCTLAERCDDGACVAGSADVGIEAGADAGSDVLDAGRDAPPPTCAPSCAATEVCSWAGCLPRQTIEGYGNNGEGLTAHRGGDGTIFVAGLVFGEVTFAHAPGSSSADLFTVSVPPEGGTGWLTGVDVEGPLGEVSGQFAIVGEEMWIGGVTADSGDHTLTIAPGRAGCERTVSPSRRSGFVVPLRIDDGCPGEVRTFPGAAVASLLPHPDGLYFGGIVSDQGGEGEVRVGDRVLDPPDGGTRTTDAGVFRPGAWVADWHLSRGVEALAVVFGSFEMGRALRLAADDAHACVAGYARPDVLFDGGPSGRGGPFVACFDPSLGTLQRAWAPEVESLYTTVSSVLIDGDVVWASGVLVRPLSLGGAPDIVPVGDSDGWLGRFDLSSGEVTLRRVGSAGDDYLAALTRGDDGELYAALIHEGDLNVGATSLRASEGMHAILRLDETGAPVWARSLPLFGATVRDDRDGRSLLLHVTHERGVREITYVAHAPGREDVALPFVIAHLRDEGSP